MSSWSIQDHRMLLKQYDEAFEKCQPKPKTLKGEIEKSAYNATIKFKCYATITRIEFKRSLILKKLYLDEKKEAEKYQPGNEGYLEAKEHFDSLI